MEAAKRRCSRCWRSVVGGKWALGGLGPFIEKIRVGTEREVGMLRPAGSWGSGPTTSDALEGALE